MQDYSDDGPNFALRVKLGWQNRLLTLTMSFGDPHDLRRYEIISCFASNFMARILVLFTKDCRKVLRQLYENNEEPVVFRVHAAFLLGLQFTGGARQYLA